jgi:hypothetical protein
MRRPSVLHPAQRTQERRVQRYTLFAVWIVPAKKVWGCCCAGAAGGQAPAACASGPPPHRAGAAPRACRPLWHCQNSEPVDCATVPGSATVPAPAQGKARARAGIAPLLAQQAPLLAPTEGWQRAPEGTLGARAGLGAAARPGAAEGRGGGGGEGRGGKFPRRPAAAMMEKGSTKGGGRGAPAHASEAPPGPGDHRDAHGTSPKGIRRPPAGGRHGAAGQPARGEQKGNVRPQRRGLGRAAGRGARAERRELERLERQGGEAMTGAGFSRAQGAPHAPAQGKPTGAGRALRERSGPGRGRRSRQGAGGPARGGGERRSTLGMRRLGARGAPCGGRAGAVACARLQSVQASGRPGAVRG